MVVFEKISWVVVEENYDGKILIENNQKLRTSSVLQRQNKMQMSFISLCHHM